MKVILFYLENPAITFMSNVQGHNWGKLTVNFYKFFSNSELRDETKILFYTSKISKQTLYVNCTNFAKLFGSGSVTQYKDAKETGMTKFLGANNDKTCPCYNTRSCINPGSKCNCDGINEQAIDSGTAEFDLSKEISVTNYEIPVYSFQIQEASVDFEWKITPLLGYSDDGLGYYFKFNDTGSAHYDKRFTISEIKKLAFSEDRNGVEVIEEIRISVVSELNNYIHCFKRFSDCHMGISLAFWMKFPFQHNQTKTIMRTFQSGGGFKISWNDGKLIFNVYYHGRFWENSIPFLTNSWMHIITTWHPIIGAKLYINNLDSLNLGGTEYTDLRESTQSNSFYLNSNYLKIGEQIQRTGEVFYITEFYLSENYIFSEKDRKKLSKTREIHIYLSLENATNLPNSWTGSNLKSIRGAIGNAVELDKLSKFFAYTCPVSLEFCNKKLMVSFWYKLNFEKDSYKFFSFGRNIQLFYDGNGLINLTSIYLDNPVQFYSTKNNWNHILLSLSNVSIDVYLNGVFMRSENVNEGHKNTDISTNFTIIGKNMAIDEIYIQSGSFQSNTSKLYYNNFNRSYYFSMDNLTDEYLWLNIDNSNELVNGRIGKASLIHEKLISFQRFQYECLSQLLWCYRGFTLSFWFNIRENKTDDIFIINFSNLLKIYYNSGKTTLNIEIMNNTYSNNNEIRLIKTNLYLYEWNFISLSYKENTILLFINNNSINNFTEKFINTNKYVNEPAPIIIGNYSKIIIDDIIFEEKFYDHHTNKENFGE